MPGARVITFSESVLSNTGVGSTLFDEPACLIVYTYDYASDKMKLLFYCYWLVNCKTGRSVASAFIDGTLHRETSNWNHKQVITFLDSRSASRSKLVPAATCIASALPRKRPFSPAPENIAPVLFDALTARCIAERPCGMGRPDRRVVVGIAAGAAPARCPWAMGARRLLCRYGKLDK